MGGRANRSKGNRWEVTCAKELAEATGHQVVTTRFLGSHYGADLATVMGHDQLGRPVTHHPWVTIGGVRWSVEAKSVQQRCPRAWLRQAHQQAAPGTTPVVLWQRKYHPFGAGSAFLADDEAPRGWMETTISEWLAFHLAAAS